MILEDRIKKKKEDPSFVFYHPKMMMMVPEPHICHSVFFVCLFVYRENLSFFLFFLCLKEIIRREIRCFGYTNAPPKETKQVNKSFSTVGCQNQFSNENKQTNIVPMNE